VVVKIDPAPSPRSGKKIPTAAVAALVGLSVQTVIRYRTTNPEFPRPYRLHSKRYVYDELEVIAWLESRRLEGAHAPTA